jgi:hypothetical protein
LSKNNYVALYLWQLLNEDVFSVAEMRGFNLET